MTKLQWDGVGDKFFETGVDRTVLYPQVAGAYPLGVPWNGVTNIEESPSGAEATPFYADNQKYLTLMSAESYSAKLEAYMYPDEFASCDGSAELAPGITAGQQPRTPFGLSYRTLLGNDTELEQLGYKIHVIYGCMAAPTSKAHGTINDSPEPGAFSWDLSTNPITVTGLVRPTATLEFDSTKLSAPAMAAVEALLWGDAAAGVAHLPTPEALAAAVAAAGA